MVYFYGRGRERGRGREGRGSFVVVNPYFFIGGLPRWKRYCAVRMSTWAVVVVALRLLFYHFLPFQLQPPDERLLCY